MKSSFLRFSLCSVASAGALLSGCLFQPNTLATRQFVLTPQTSPAAVAAGGPQPAPAVGVGAVKMPSYLLRSALAVRRGTNEIEYVDSVLWAEPLDQSFQQSLGANLSALLRSNRIRLTSWQSGDVTCGVYVALTQFEVDTHGTGILAGWWRITSSATGQVLNSGQSRLSRDGPEPFTNPEGAVGTLSALNAELSETIAKALKELK